MKIFKWILGLFAAIGGILAIMSGGSNRKRVKELKSKIKDVDEQIKNTGKENTTILKTSPTQRS